jgi:amidase
MSRARDTSKDSPEYLSILQKQDYYAGSGGFEGAMERHDCDVIIAPGGSLSIQAFAAMGGIPVMTVPMGFYPEETEVKFDESRGG